jgi:HK97 gp10 family phage protein
VAINWALLKEQIVEAAVVAVNATALNTADRAREKAPVRKVFSGGRQTVRFKSATEVNADRELVGRLGLGPQIIATAQAVGRVQRAGLNPKRSRRIGGEEFGFARTVEGQGRTHTVHGVTHQDRLRNLRNKANSFRATQDVRLLDPLNYAQLQSEEAEQRLTSRGRYELASKRAVSARVRVDQDTGRPIIIARLGGALRDSIRVERASAAQYPVIKASVVAGGGDVDYAKDQELGTRHNPAHPFMRPALAQARDELPDQLLRSLRRLGR